MIDQFLNALLEPALALSTDLIKEVSKLAKMDFDMCRNKLSILLEIYNLEGTRETSVYFTFSSI